MTVKTVAARAGASMRSGPGSGLAAPASAHGHSALELLQVRRARYRVPVSATYLSASRALAQMEASSAQCCCWLLVSPQLVGPVSHVVCPSPCAAWSARVVPSGHRHLRPRNRQNARGWRSFGRGYRDLCVQMHSLTTFLQLGLLAPQCARLPSAG